MLLLVVDAVEAAAAAADDDDELDDFDGLDVAELDALRFDQSTVGTPA